MIVDIFNEVYTKLTDNINGASVLVAYPSDAPVFPCVVFQELSNTTNVNSVDTNGEQYNDVSFQVELYSNSTNKSTEIRNLRNQVDEILGEFYGMTRSFGSALPNLADVNVYRYTMRYDFTIGKSKTIYRR